MKTLIKSAIIGLALAGLAQATPSSSYSTQNSTTQNVKYLTEPLTSFTFNQFNPSLGTLSAVELIVQSSTLQGNFTLTKSSGSRTFSSIEAVLNIVSVPGYTAGGNTYSSDLFAFNRSPSGTFTVTAGSQNVSVTGTNQSLIGGSPVTLSINPGSFGVYTGLSTITFDTNTELVFNSGTSYSINAANLLAPTQLSLRYTYTPGTAPVPEPGQVAASLLLLGGIGGYIFIKRRRKPAVAAA